MLHVVHSCSCQVTPQTYVSFEWRPGEEKVLHLFLAALKTAHLAHMTQGFQWCLACQWPIKLQFGSLEPLAGKPQQVIKSTVPYDFKQSPVNFHK